MSRINLYFKGQKVHSEASLDHHVDFGVDWRRGLCDNGFMVSDGHLDFLVVDKHHCCRVVVPAIVRRREYLRNVIERRVSRKKSAEGTVRHFEFFET
jgi:hypothetical protein